MILALFVVLIVLFVVLPVLGWALWTLLSALVVGLLIGALGRLVVPGRQAIGLLATAVIGLAGSLVGTVIGHGIGVGHLATVLLEIGVAAALVAGYAGIDRRRLARPGHRGLPPGW